MLTSARRADRPTRPIHKSTPINRATTDITKLRPKEELYIALEELDFTWYTSQVDKVRQMWEAGEHIADIAEAVKRDQDEVAILLMSLSRSKKIGNRTHGVFGEAKEVN